MTMSMTITMTMSISKTITTARTGCSGITCLACHIAGVIYVCSTLHPVHVLLHCTPVALHCTLLILCCLSTSPARARSVLCGPCHTMQALIQLLSPICRPGTHGMASSRGLGTVALCSQSLMVNYCPSGIRYKGNLALRSQGRVRLSYRGPKWGGVGWRYGRHRIGHSIRMQNCGPCTIGGSTCVNPVP